MKASTVKSVAALALTGVGSALVVGFQVPDAALATTGTQTTTTTALALAAATATTSGATATAAAATSAAGTTTTTTAAGYKDGTYTGAAVSEPWGSFQVQVTISGGRITNVAVVQAPADSKSSSINSRAVPTLTQAAIASQSASIDLVSGATWTSRSYITSLQAALDAAKA
jgi:uncharacterized protein with FMN-binding domain